MQSQLQQSPTVCYISRGRARKHGHRHQEVVGGRKWFTGTFVERGVGTLLELGGTVVPPKVPSAVQIFHTACLFLYSVNHNMGLGLICWGFRATEEVWTRALRHKNQRTSCDPLRRCNGYAIALCQGGLWVRKGVIGYRGKLSVSKVSHKGNVLRFKRLTR